MGLRMSWEVPEGLTLNFVSVDVLSTPRAGAWPDFGRKKQLRNSLDTGLETIEGPLESHIEGNSNRLLKKLGLDKSKKDFLIGVQALYGKSPEQAAEAFRRVILRDDTVSDALFALVLCAQNSQEQLEAADRAVLQQKQFTHLFKKLGVELCATFIACDGRQMRIMSDQPGLEIVTAEIYQNHGKLESAQRLLELSQYADLDIFRYSRGELLYQLHRYEEAIDTMRRLNDNPALAAPAFYFMGLSLEALGYHSTAIQVYRNCLKLESFSKRLECAMRIRLAELLEREEKKWMAKQERERLAVLEIEIQQEMD